MRRSEPMAPRVVAIVVRVYHERAPNGDRATTLSWAPRVEVVMESTGDPSGGGVVLREFRSHDNGGMGGMDGEATVAEAKRYAINVAGPLGIAPKTEDYDPVVTTTWRKRSKPSERPLSPRAKVR